MRNIFVVLLLMIYSMAVSGAPNGDIDKLRPAIESVMRDAGVVGLAIARLERGHVVETRTFGERELAGPAVTANTAFQTASLGKVAVAYATLILVQQGKLSLDQPLTDPRIEVADGCAKPTVRSVLTHTSGMGNDLTASNFALPCQPGAAFRYSGQGFLALATELERATGTPAAELVTELVFAPLGMTHSRFGYAGDASDVAKGHISLTAYGIGQALGKPLEGVGLLVNVLLLALLLAPAWIARRQGWRRGIAGYLFSAVVISLLVVLGLGSSAIAERKQPTEMIPASLTSNITDMGRFAAELLEPRLLSAVSVEQSLGQQVRVSDCIGWSLLMGTDQCDEQATTWQWGSNLGFQSLMVLQHGSGSAVVILTNSGGGLDTAVPGKGGYPAAKRLAAELLGINGRWDLKH